MTSYYVALALLVGIIIGTAIGYHLAPDTSIWHCAVKPV